LEGIFHSEPKSIIDYNRTLIKVQLDGTAAVSDRETEKDPFKVLKGDYIVFKISNIITLTAHLLRQVIPQNYFAVKWDQSPQPKRRELLEFK